MHQETTIPPAMRLLVVFISL